MTQLSHYAYHCSRLALWFLIVTAGVCCAPQERLPHSRLVVLGQQRDIPNKTGEDFTARYQQLLTAYVQADGRVDYKKMKNDPCAIPVIEGYVRYLPLTTSPQDQPLTAKQTADWLNAHNACVLRAVLAYYPFEQIDALEITLDRDILFDFLPDDWNLRAIEQYCVQPPWQNAAYGLAQPTLGGPKITCELFTAADLSIQLYQAKQRYLCSCAGLRIDHENRRLLYGPLLFSKREELIADYTAKLKDKYRKIPATLTQALIPLAKGQTQRQMSEFLSYEPAELVYDTRLNDRIRHRWFKRIGQKIDRDLMLPCGN